MTARAEDGTADTSVSAQDLEDYYKPWCEKGNISCLISFLILIFGAILTFASDPDSDTAAFGIYVLSFGLFGFAGGITNLIAVYMLFERVPFLAGSGVIPNRYVEIRGSVKEVIMGSFFDAEFLEEYIGAKLKTVGDDIDTDTKVKELVESEGFDGTLDEKLAGLGEKPEFAMLAGFGGAAALKPIIKPFVSALALELAPLLKNKLCDAKFTVDIKFVRDEIEKYMNARLETLTEEKVTRLLEFVIRGHLGWLIFWGNVFGALIGLVSEALNLTPEYLMDGGDTSNSTMA